MPDQQVKSPNLRYDGCMGNKKNRCPDPKYDGWMVLVWVMLLFFVTLGIAIAGRHRNRDRSEDTGFMNSVDSMSGAMGPRGEVGPRGRSVIVNGDNNSGGGIGRRMTVHELSLLKGRLPAVVSGLNGIWPWFQSAEFSDGQASWIWSIPDANVSAPPGKIRFLRTFKNTSGGTINATMTLRVDNMATVTVNSTKLGDFAGWGTTTYKFPLPVGDSLIVIDAINAGNSPNPAGLIYSIRDGDTGKVLTHSDTETSFVSLE